MTPAQWNEYERQAQVIERHEKWKEQQKQLITEIMDLDGKDGLYEHTSHRGNPRPYDVQKLAEEYIIPPKQKPEESDGYNEYDVFKAYIDGYNKAKETLYTEEQVREAIKKATTRKYNSHFFNADEIIQSLKK